MDKKKDIITASFVGILVNGLLAILKISTGFYAHSLAVIGDGIDSSTDVATYFITLVAARMMFRPPNPKFPFGYTRAEAIATKLLSFFIFFVGAQLVLNSGMRLWNGTESPSIELIALAVTLISVLAKIVLTIWQMKKGRALDSKMLIANAKNMQSDIILSLGVLLGISISYYTGLPWLDPLVALLVGVWILKVAYDLFAETSTELMDSNNDPEIYRIIFEAVASIEGAHNPHKARARKMSNLWVIDLDIEVEADLSMKEVHEIGIRVENEIKSRVENVYDIMIHFEPLGNEENEKFGVGFSHIK